MKKSLKIASITVILFLLLGVLAFGGPLTAADEERGSPPDNRPPDNRPPRSRPPMPIDLPMPYRRECDPKLGLFKRMLANATPIDVDGTVAALFKGMLVLDTDEGHIRIHLPEVWSLDYEVLQKEELFNNTFSSVGQNVTVKALKARLFENDGFLITVMVGYEIINADSTYAYAVLPFNIEVED